MNIVTDINDYSKLFKFGDREYKEDFFGSKFGDPRLTPSFTHLTNVRALFYVISIFKNKALDFTFSSGFFKSSPCMVLFRSPFHLYSIKRGAAIEGYNLMFTQAFISYSFQNNNFQRDFPYFWNEKNHFLVDEKEEQLLTDICDKILFEQDNPTLYTRDIIASLLRLFLFEFNKIAAIPRPVTNSLNSDSLTHQFFEIVNTSVIVPRSVEKIAAKLNVTTNHLWDNIKKITGQTPSQIINERILTDAKALLLQNELSVAEISLQLNFKEHAHFTRFFKNLTGLSPSAFLLQKRQEKGKPGIV